MRLFVASFFEPGFVESLRAMAVYARANAGRDTVKWVEPSNFHVTYAFLGEVDETGAAAVAKSMAHRLEGVKAFNLASGGFGVFPSARRPAVLWVGIGEGAGQLRGIAGKIVEALSDCGLAFEDRFEPHITIGRIKRPLPDNFLRRAGNYSISGRAVSRLVSVELMESGQTADGPVYRRIYSKRLL